MESAHNIWCTVVGLVDLISLFGRQQVACAIWTAAAIEETIAIRCVLTH